MDAGFEVVESDFDVPPTEEMVSLYHSLIGSIGYVTNTVSFDVRYGLSVLSRFLAKPNDKKNSFCGRDLWRSRCLVYYGPYL
jgi:hypothetical protein